MSDLMVRVYMGFRAFERYKHTGSCFFFAFSLPSSTLSSLCSLTRAAASASEEPENINCLWCLHSTTSSRGKMGNTGQESTPQIGDNWNSTHEDHQQRATIETGTSSATERKNRLYRGETQSAMSVWPHSAAQDNSIFEWVTTSCSSSGQTGTCWDLNAHRGGGGGIKQEHSETGFIFFHSLRKEQIGVEGC